MSKEWTVAWIIDVDADNEQEAAEAALELMKGVNDPEFLANTFAVLPFQNDSSVVDGATWIDLGEEDKPLTDEEVASLREINSKLV
jgi:hypothetical protein